MFAQPSNVDGNGLLRSHGGLEKKQVEQNRGATKKNDVEGVKISVRAIEVDEERRPEKIGQLNILQTMHSQLQKDFCNTPAEDILVRTERTNV